ncbi:MAG: dienelactone hydrolase family protein [Planctomycetia bacterium]|nr:dienelactone hydrolase family protein [Planctomycetia bacterium]
MPYQLIKRTNPGQRFHFSLIVVVVMLSQITAISAQTTDVPWLEEVQKLPPNPPRERLGKMTPILIDDSGKAITTRAGWDTQRKQVRAEWLKFLGPMPEPHPAVKLEVLKTEQLPEVVRQLVRYEGEPGLFVEGYLLMPIAANNSGKKRAAIVALHQTTNASIDEIAGVSGPDTMQIGLKLAKRGFVVFCPRCFLWQNVKDLNEAVAKYRERHPNSLGMAKMLYDAMRGTDILASLPDVDVNRIGAVGHSLGAKEALYLAAFDERIKAAVASEGGTAFRSTNWDAPWYLGPAIRDENFSLNHHQLLALMAPRPFLILGGESGSGAADGDRSWPLLDAAIPAWKLYGDPTRLGLLNHHQGHSIPEQVFERTAEWLETYLR